MNRLLCDPSNQSNESTIKCTDNVYTDSVLLIYQRPVSKQSTSRKSVALASVEAVSVFSAAVGQSEGERLAGPIRSTAGRARNIRLSNDLIAAKQQHNDQHDEETLKRLHIGTWIG